MRKTRVLLLVMFSGLVCSGCGDSSPFPLAPVQGTVKYEDGSLIPANHIRVIFEPQGLQQVGKVAPAAAQGHVNEADGTFSQLTTWTYGDGAIVGRHKIRVMSLQVDSRGAIEPTAHVPRIYQRTETTPLEAEVVRGKNNFDFRIPKPS